MTTAASDGRRQGWRHATRIALAATIGAIVVRLLGLTWRVRWMDDAERRSRRGSRPPVVLVVWHGELLPLLWAHRGRGIAVVVSTHADGEIITRILESLGFEAIRGSSSRGGARALLEAAARLKDGGDVAVTPDGPRGPRHVFAPGAVIAAFRARAPVVAVGARVSRSWQLGSWDRMVIPKPFATIRVQYSEPTYVEAESLRDAEQETARFERLLHQVSASDAPGS